MQRAVTAGSRIATTPPPRRSLRSTTIASNVSPTRGASSAASMIDTIPASYWPARPADRAITSGSAGNSARTHSGISSPAESATHASPT